MSAAVLEFAPRNAASRSAVPRSAAPRSAAPRDAAPRAEEPRSHLRLTRRGRAVFTTLAALPLVIAALFFVLNGGGAIATSGTEQLEQITVQPGQTLWDLAEEYAPTADPRDFIADIMSVNELGVSLVAGDTLAIPAKYSD